jgi:hypothetical protein
MLNNHSDVWILTMPWNDFLGGDQLTPTDPLQILQSIAGSAPPERDDGGGRRAEDSERAAT